MCVFLFSFCRKLKLYEEQELTMQVFSEPEISQIENTNDVSASSERRDSYEVSQIGDNTYATILPRNLPHAMVNSSNETNGTIRSLRMPSNSAVSTIENAELADYATLRNISRAPSTVCLTRKKTESDIYSFIHWTHFPFFQFQFQFYSAVRVHRFDVSSAHPKFRRKLCVRNYVASGRCSS